MNSLLQDLYYGKLDPGEQFISTFTEYEKMRNVHSAHYTEFVEKLKNLDPTLIPEFLNLLDEQLDSTPLESSEIFIQGFRMGSKMMLEILTGLNTNIIQEPVSLR